MPGMNFTGVTRPFSTLRNEGAIGPAALTPVDKLTTFGTSGLGCQVKEGGVGCLSRKAMRSESNTNHTSAVWPWAMVSLSLSFPFGKQGWFRIDVLSTLVLGSKEPGPSLEIPHRAEVAAGEGLSVLGGGHDSWEPAVLESISKPSCLMVPGEVQCRFHGICLFAASLHHISGQHQ